MKTRVNNKNVESYKDYGGRGIIICDRWYDFANFRDDMGDPPPGCTLERIDNNGNYEPNNCRWTERKYQSRNRRMCRPITYRGKTKLLSDWSNDLNINRETISRRLASGMTPEKAFETPVRKSGLTFNGTTKSILQWAKTIGISHQALDERIKRWGIEIAITMPRTNSHGITRAAKSGMK